MKKRTGFAIVVVLVLLGIGVPGSVSRTGKGIYDGYPFVIWVEGLGRVQQHEQSTPPFDRWTIDDMLATVYRTGAKGFPCLRRCISYEKHSRLTGLTASVRRFFGTTPLYSKAEIRAVGAVRALEILGPQATPMIPDLVKLMNTPGRLDTAERVMTVLGHMGTNGLPHLVAFLDNPVHPNRCRAHAAISAITRLGPSAKPAVPALIRSLRDPDPSTAACAAAALGALALEPEVSVPALTNATLNSIPAVRIQSVAALAAFRAHAAQTLPCLTALLADPNSEVRAAATNTLGLLQGRSKQQDDAESLRGL